MKIERVVEIFKNELKCREQRCTAGEGQCPAVLPFAELYEDGEQE